MRRPAGNEVRQIEARVHATLEKTQLGTLLIDSRIKEH